MDERIWTIAEILDKSGPMTADELAAQLKLSGKSTAKHGSKYWNRCAGSCVAKKSCRMIFFSS